MSRKNRRGLRADELELWQRVARTARPLKPALAEETVVPRDDPDVERMKADFAQADGSDKLRNSVKSHVSPASLEVSRPSPSLRMDHKTFSKMTKGRISPQGRVDLHGLTAEAAHSVLVNFLLNAQRSGKRLVLVITGKGRPSVDGNWLSQPRGVLRQQLPVWVTQPPLSAVVQQISEAHQKHGGSGAFYVYLRRARQ